jgi:hypothetical protein
MGDAHVVGVDDEDPLLGPVAQTLGEVHGSPPSTAEPAAGDAVAQYSVRPFQRKVWRGPSARQASPQTKGYEPGSGLRRAAGRVQFLHLAKWQRHLAPTSTGRRTCAGFRLDLRLSGTSVEDRLVYLTI